MCGHIKRCHNPEMPRPLPCPLCPQTFSTSAALNKHKTNKHPAAADRWVKKDTEFLNPSMIGISIMTMELTRNVF